MTWTDEDDPKLVSDRFWCFAQRVTHICNRAKYPAANKWIDDQDSNIWCLMSDACNNDKPCKYARSYGE